MAISGDPNSETSHHVPADRRKIPRLSIKYIDLHQSISRGPTRKKYSCVQKFHSTPNKKSFCRMSDRMHVLRKTLAQNAPHIQILITFNQAALKLTRLSSDQPDKNHKIHRSLSQLFPIAL